MPCGNHRQRSFPRQLGNAAKLEWANEHKTRRSTPLSLEMGWPSRYDSRSRFRFHEGPTLDVAGLGGVAWRGYPESAGSLQTLPG